MSPAYFLSALRAVRFLLAILAVLLALSVLAVHQTRAQTTVTVADGDVQGLITAIENANSSSGSVTIELASSGDYVLTAEYTEDPQKDGLHGLPIITGEITIEGHGATIRRAPNSDSFRIFEISSNGDLHLKLLTVSGGETPWYGGGIYNHGGNLTVTDSSIINNKAGLNGGGIFAWDNATVEMTGGTISGNAAGYDGGGIGNGANTTIEITSATISGNTAGYWGGGISNVSSDMTLTNSTVSGNKANDGGGGSSSIGELTLTNSTVSGNEANDSGGGIRHYSRDNIIGTKLVTLINSTVSGNKAYQGGGIDNPAGDLIITSSTVSDNEAVFGSGISNHGSLMLTSSIVAGNTTTPGSNTIIANIDGSIDSNIANFIEGDPQLGPLQNNGGPTETHLPLPGSPVLNQIPRFDHGCGVGDQFATDQRGVPRPQGTHCDIGAVERFVGFNHLEQIVNPWFWATSVRTDLPVHNGHVSRTWMWGPGPFTTSIWEPYTTVAQNPGGDPVFLSGIPESEREVIYFDKARMEINDPDGDSDSIWFVTNGLLVMEMITGNRQFGDDLFKHYEPSHSNVAGDADDIHGPTYASFQRVLDAPAQSVGTLLTGQIDRSGTVTSSSSWGAFGVTVGHVDPVTEHGIAGPFWEFMNSQGLVHEGGATVEDALFENPFYATGRPVTEAYWADVKVAGEQRDVLMQCFERRCLTYTPGNSPGFVVEAGNVGQHYYFWRYIQAPD